MNTPTRILRLGLVITATVIGFAHPADLIGGGTLLGAGSSRFRALAFLSLNALVEVSGLEPPISTLRKWVAATL